MATEKFTKQEFEAALEGLPLGDKGHMFLANPIHLGTVQGEYSYLIPVTSRAGILIRSSVDHTGVARGLAKDSIRVYPTEIIQKIGPKPGYNIRYNPDFRWITRVAGWDKRLRQKIRKLARAIQEIGDCSVCNRPLQMYKSKKKNENEGRWFANCKDWNHKQFKWIDWEE